MIHMLTLIYHCRVYTAKFNKFHDQLILSAGTDSIVNLWRVSSISSAPLLDINDDNKYASLSLSLSIYFSLSLSLSLSLPINTHEQGYT